MNRNGGVFEANYSRQNLHNYVYHCHKTVLFSVDENIIQSPERILLSTGGETTTKTRENFMVTKSMALMPHY